ncbi:unnamed protein product [Clonostachys rosea f. rosea IK726]|uniref:Uncharacterized protein n=1 Tax=Clonostachys rosea f. rosea IK726 TaxID=1349383 RepID=A0ACA9U4W2_BIOOC|nr:unnamed protein product [Clonostachys rosea f. rosea IK726]
MSAMHDVIGTADVLLGVLSASHNTGDLYSLVRSSRVVYEVFRSAKRTVLISIVARDLGWSGLRTATATTLITRATFRQGAGYEGDAKTAIKLYESIAHEDRGISFAKGLSEAEFTNLVRINRGVQFVVDQYAATRLPRLQEINLDAGAELNFRERQRLAHAFLRHQVLASIQSLGVITQGTVVYEQLLDLFRPWEVQQITDVHSFLRVMASFVFPSRERIPRSLWGVYLTGREWWRDSDEQEAMGDLVVIRARFLEKIGHKTMADLEMELDISKREREARHNIMPASYNFLAAGSLPQTSSSQVTEHYWSLRDEIYQREDALPGLFAVEDDEDGSQSAPFGWIDGHRGIDCQRWGGDLFRETLPPGQENLTALQMNGTRLVVRQWRWLGFIFWDRERVELLKSKLPEYATGWLTRPPPCDDNLSLEGL